MADRRKDERTCDETRCWRNEPGSQFSRMCVETCRRKIRNQRQGRFEVVAQLPHFSCQRSTPRESPLELATTTQTQARRHKGKPRCEYVDKVNVYDCHSASCSSSWKRLFGKFTFDQQSAIKKYVRCDKKVGQGSERNPRYICDRWQENSWKRTTLLTDRAVRLSTAKAYVFSDSVLCVDRIS